MVRVLCARHSASNTTLPFAKSKINPYLCITMSRKDIIDRISEELKKIVPEAEVILYGSEARGDARPDSDIDILILLPEFNDIKRYIAKRSEISGHLFELSLDLEVEISPLVLPRSVWNARKTPFTINVTNEGKRI